MDNFIYIVCWMTTLEKPDKEGNTHKDHYLVFMDGEDNLKDAQEQYQLLINNKNVYSANIAKLVQSTDYS